MGNFINGVADNSWKWTRPSNEDSLYVGKKYFFVGGTDGIGRALAKLAASKGADVTVIGRTFRDEGIENISFIRADLSSMGEAVNVAKKIPADKVDAIVLTCGILAPTTRKVSDEGLELDMAVSYFSRLAIINTIRPILGIGRNPTLPKPRIFVMGFPGTGKDADIEDLQGEKKYSAFTVHMNTVAGNEALVLDNTKKTPNAAFFGLNPGLIKTKIRNQYLGEGSWASYLVEGFIGMITPTPEQYAAKILPLLVAPELNDKSGALFNQNGVVIKRSAPLNDQRVEAIIDASNNIISTVLTK